MRLSAEKHCGIAANFNAGNSDGGSTGSDHGNACEVSRETGHRSNSAGTACKVDGWKSLIGHYVSSLKAGLPTVGFHSLRHYHASTLLRANVDVLTVSRRLGHANAAITLNTYGHVIEGADAAAAKAIEGVLLK